MRQAGFPSTPTLSTAQSLCGMEVSAWIAATSLIPSMPFRERRNETLHPANYCEAEYGGNTRLRVTGLACSAHSCPCSMGAEALGRGTLPGLLWAVVAAHLFCASAVMGTLRAFGLPPPPLAPPTGALRRVLGAAAPVGAGSLRHRDAASCFAGPSAARRRWDPPHASTDAMGGSAGRQKGPSWPLLARHAALALRGGARELSVASARRRGAAEPASADSDDSEARAKQQRSSKGGDLVDVCAATGAELRRRSRGRGRSLVGYELQPSGDWVRIVDTPAPQPAARPQTTLSPFLVAKSAAAGPPAAPSEDDDELISQPDQSVDTPTVADQIQMLMGGGAGGEVDIPPLDESLWDDASLPSKWVVFSDLHVSRSSLGTCLRVLQAVHDEAMARGAGVIFLGVFTCVHSYKHEALYTAAITHNCSRTGHY